MSTSKVRAATHLLGAALISCVSDASDQPAGLTLVPRDREVWHLRLYVAGQSRASLRALANLNTLCEEHLPRRCRIEVIDLVEHPELANSDDVLVIPTLVRRRPAPLRKIIGDLSNTGRVLAGLDLDRGAPR